MSEQDADRLRDAIQHDQTACRCGHLLAACADCRDWLTEHSPRIVACWRDWLNFWIDDYKWMRGADAAEADNLTHYLAGR